VFPLSGEAAAVRLLEVETETAGWEAKTTLVCPRCYPEHVEKSTLSQGTARVGSVYVAYQCESGCRPDEESGGTTMETPRSVLL